MNRAYPPPHNPARPDRSKRIALIVVGVVAVVAVATSAALALLVDSGDNSSSGDPSDSSLATGGAPEPTADQPMASVDVGPTDEPPEPFPPGGPVPCRPDLPTLDHCFPPEVTWRSFIKRVDAEPGWDCRKEGEPDPNGPGETDGVRQCDHDERVNDRKLTETIRVETDDYKESGTLTEVGMVASTGVKESEQSTDAAETAKVSDRVLDRVLRNLWPGDEGRQHTVKQAFAEAQRGCLGESGAFETTVETTLGYEVSCQQPIPISFTDEDGAKYTAVTQSFYLKAPMNRLDEN